MGRPRKHQSRPWLTEKRRRLYARYARLMMELRVEDPQSFFGYLRMEPAMFDELVQRVVPRIEEHDAKIRKTRLLLGTFRLHSSRIRAAIDSVRRHLKCIPAEFFPCEIRFRQQSRMYSRCILAHSRRTRDIRTGFEVACHFDYPRMRSKCVEYCWNAVRILRKQSEYS